MEEQKTVIGAQAKGNGPLRGIRNDGSGMMNFEF